MTSPQPIPPVNVRIVFCNREIPVECVFTGRGSDGVNRWVAVMPIDIGDAQVPQLLIDDLPPATSVMVELKGTY